jgi:non-specific protein-tyrosine kinase
LARYVETVRERLWIVIATVALTTAAAVAYVTLAEKQYEAQSELLVRPSPCADPAFYALPLICESTDPTRAIDTASRLVTSNEIAQRVQEELGTDRTPEELLTAIKSEPIADSDLIAITARDSTAAGAQAIANGFAEGVVAERTQELHQQAERITADLRVQLRALPEGSTEAIGLQEQLGAVELLRTGEDPSLAVERLASLPEAAVSPRPTLSIAGGIVAGLVLGVVAAFALQALDPRLRREEQLRRLYALPVLGRIPKETGNKSSAPLNPLAVSPATAEAFRTLRGTLAASRRRDGQSSRAILVTGSSPAEGKTSTAINLASSLAAAGRSVILIEGDLRRPTIGAALDVRPEHGVVSVLIESVALEDALVSAESLAPGLKLLLADYQGGWITELFSLASAAELIEEAKQLADYVIVDSPPLADFVDALPLATYVDDLLIVCRLGKTHLNKLQQLGEILAENGIAPTGFAVVGVPRPRRDAYYYYRDPGRSSGGSKRRRRKDAAASG